MPNPTKTDNSFLWLLALTLAGAFGWSAVDPHDRLTWVLEVVAVVIGVVILVATYRAFRFTNLAYAMIGLHALILLVGGHYTYSEVPLFNWVRDTLELSRNHYDRVGHLAQGFFPAIIAREILIRLSPVEPGKWLFVIVTCIALAISVFYEMIEWWVVMVERYA